jgi:hypothetical protein
MLVDPAFGYESVITYKFPISNEVLEEFLPGGISSALEGDYV